MNFDLTFFDKRQEQAYKINLRGYRYKYMKFYMLCSFIIANVIWFLNPHGVKNLEGNVLLNNIVNELIFFCVAIFIFRIKKFSHPQIGILVLQFYICVAYIESSMDFRAKFNDTSYISITLMMENMVLIPMIARCNWKFNALASGLLNLYFNFRLVRFSDNKTMNGYPSIILFGNFLVNSVGCYLTEKYDRETFQEKYVGDRNLKRFETIIKEVIPSAIIISREHDIVFYNKEAKSLLGFQETHELNEILKDISIREKNLDDNDSEKLKDIKIFGLHVLDSKNSEILETPKKHKKIGTLSDLLLLAKDKLSINCFQFFEGKIKRRVSSRRVLYLEIKIGVIIWEGEPALMTIMSENSVSRQLHFLKEQTIFKDRLLATVSHDLRTPLNGIIGIIDITLESIVDKEARKNLLLALRSSKLLQFLINDILDFTQLSNGKLSLIPQTFNVVEILMDVAKLIKFQAKRKGLKFIFQNDIENCFNNTLLIRSDPNRLKQVILNLLSNALKFTEKGYLLLKIDQPSPGSSAIRFAVCDSGSGMKPEEISQLFHVFGKLKNTENRRLNQIGIGLGLAISQNLVRHLNSFAPGEEIKVESETGKGSVFSFILHPMKEESEKSEKEENELVIGESSTIELIKDDNGINPLPKPLNCNASLDRPEVTNNRKIRILLVDDDQINILALRAYFNSFKDCEYDTAFNGKQAVDLIETKAWDRYFYDLIFMDINMPVLDGFQATTLILKMIHENTIPKLIIIATTANSSPIDYKKSFDCGMNDHITKPFTKDQLRGSIDKWTKNLGS